ncbi:MAG: phage integrase N-terminal SAM-like domain-containing protein [Planctomycetales bacterium]|nr:phage integrase N-terminal SAM-like domain-containing protein [Planctomycetales bacterium]
MRSWKEASFGLRQAEPSIEALVDGLGAVTMTINLETVFIRYLKAKKLSGGTCKEYKSTLTKWLSWGNGVEVEGIERSHVREFIDWVYERAVDDGGSNPGKTANKARENLRAIVSWAWEQDYIDKLPRFPKPKQQRDVAGRHYLTKPDLNALYFATYQLERPRGWKQPFTFGQHWRAALVVFFFLSTALILELCSSAQAFMSRYFGGTQPGHLSLPTAKAKNQGMASSTTVA